MDLAENIEQENTFNPEKDIENLVDAVAENIEHKCFNFLINASNQANLTNTQNLSATQINSLFVLIHPYYIESLNLEDMNLDIKISEEGSVLVDGQEFKAVEVQPGIKVFGIIKDIGSELHEM